MFPFDDVIMSVPNECQWRILINYSQWTEFGENITQINKFCMDEILFELSAVICLHFLSEEVS